MQKIVLFLLLLTFSFANEFVEENITIDKSKLYLNDSGKIEKLAFSSNNEFMAMLIGDKILKIVNLKNNKEFVIEENESIYKLFFYPNNKFLLYISHEKIKIIDIENKKTILDIKRKNDFFLDRGIISYDGKYLIYPENFKTIFFNLEDKTSFYITYNSIYVTNMLLSLDNRFLILTDNIPNIPTSKFTNNRNSIIKLFDVKKKQELDTLTLEKFDDIFFIGKDKFITTDIKNNSIDFYNIKNFKLIKNNSLKTKNYYELISFLSRLNISNTHYGYLNKKELIQNFNNVINFFDLDTLQLKKQCINYAQSYKSNLFDNLFILYSGSSLIFYNIVKNKKIFESSNNISDVMFMDNLIILKQRGENFIKLIKLNDPNNINSLELVDKVPYSRDKIFNIHFSQDKKKLSIYDSDSIILYDIENNKEIKRFQDNFFLPKMKFSEDSNFFIYDTQTEVKVYDLKNKKKYNFYNQNDYELIDDINIIDKKLLIQKENNTKIFNLKNKEEILDINTYKINKNLILYYKNGNLNVFDIKTFKDIISLKANSPFYMLNGFFSKNNRYLVTSEFDDINIWDLNTKKKYFSFKFQFRNIFFSKNSNLMALIFNNTIKVFNFKTKSLIDIKNIKNSYLDYLYFSSDNNFLVYSFKNSPEIEIFNLKTKEKENLLLSNNAEIHLYKNSLIRKSNGKTLKKIVKRDGNFIELEAIYPNQENEGNITILQFPKKITIYEGNISQSEIIIKNNSNSRLWWIDLLENNVSNCNFFAPERMQFLEPNQSGVFEFGISAIRDYEFPKEKNKTITLRLEAVKTKPIIIKVPIEIKTPIIKIEKVEFDEADNNLSMWVKNIGGQDLSSSEIETILLFKDKNITLNKIDIDLIKSKEVKEINFNIPKSIINKNPKVQIIINKIEYPIHKWSFQRNILVIKSYIEEMISLGFVILIFAYYQRWFFYPLTRKLIGEKIKLIEFNLKELSRIKFWLNRSLLEKILKENNIEQFVFDNIIKFYRTNNINDKIKILSHRLISNYKKVDNKNHIFKMNFPIYFNLNINYIQVIFIKKYDEFIINELNNINSYTLIITDDEIRNKLIAYKNIFWITPTSKEIAKILISQDSLLTLSHILSNYIKVSQISPYQISQGVRNPIMFFGREKFLTHIVKRNLTNYFIIGARQIGKSSFLKEIERKFKDSSEVDCYYLTLHDEKLLELLSLNLWNKQLNLNEIVNKLKKHNKKIIFLLDEVDKFIINETQSNFKILNAFRALSEEGKCFFVMAGYWELYKSIYLNYFSPIKNFGEVLHIEELEYNACFELATKPMKALNLSYENESIVKEIVDMCGQRANLIAINCNLIIQNLDLKTKVITREMIKSAQKSQDFVSNLKFSENDKLAKAILYFTIEQTSFDLGELVKILENEGIKFEIDSLKEALNKLEIAFYLKKIENRYYYRVPIFIEYIKGDDLEVLKTEIKK